MSTKPDPTTTVTVTFTATEVKRITSTVARIATIDGKAETLRVQRQRNELQLIGVIGKIAVKHGQVRGKSVMTDGPLFLALQPLVASVGWSDDNLSRFVKVGVVAHLEGWKMTERFATPSAARAAQSLLTQAKSAEKFSTTVGKAKAPIGQADVVKAKEAFKSVKKVVAPTVVPPVDEPTDEPLTVAQVIDRIGRAVDGLTAKGVAGHVDDIDDIIATLTTLAAECREALVSA